MWKVLVFVVVLAVPIYCGTVKQKTTSLQRIMEDMWKSKCKNVSGVDVDFERIERLELKFQSCEENAMDNNQLREDIVTMFPDVTYESNFNFTDQQKADVVSFSQKYCPKLDAFLKCSDLKSPIYKECYNAEEIMGQKASAEVSQRIKVFFCKNESESVANFIDGKVTECAMENKDALMLCYQEYPIANLHVDKDNPIFGMLPTADKVCNSIEVLKRCAVPLFEQCESSSTAAKLVKSLFTDVLTKTTCADITDMNSSSKLFKTVM